jgi:glycosyltransferase involved in cell wall biosynthesis
MSHTFLFLIAGVREIYCLHLGVLKAMERKRIKVTHILRSLEYGGAERLVVGLAGFQKESGRLEPELLCMRGLGPLEADARKLGLPFSLVGLSGIRYLSPYVRVKRALEGSRPDIVHIHNFLSQMNAAPAAGRLGIPIVHTKHGRAVTSLGRLPRLRRYLYELSRAIVVVSKETGESFISKTGVDPSMVRVIYNGIHTGKYAGLDRTASRDALGFGGDVVVFGCISRLDPVKDHPTMLRALKKVCERRDGARLLIVGDGPERERIERLAGELSLGAKVHLAGFQEDVAPYLAAMDAFIQPSIQEGLSLTILEAAAAGIPIMATPVGGTPEVIRDGETGVLVGVGDADSLAGAMERFIENPEPFALMARKAREAVERTFSIEAMARSYESLYLEILQD